VVILSLILLEVACLSLNVRMEHSEAVLAFIQVVICFLKQVHVRLSHPYSIDVGFGRNSFELLLIF